jgi:hypothetical protein
MREIESEAVWRRAGPEYPHEVAARIEDELARQAPNAGGPVPLERLVRTVEDASAISIDAPVTASRREYTYVKSALKRSMAWYQRHVADQVSLFGHATARTLRAMAMRLEDLEARVAAVEHRRAAGAAPQQSGTADHLSHWTGDVAEQLTGVSGRVLCADAHIDELVTRLRAGGLDAYGLVREGDPYLLSPDVRQGDLITHLGSVAAGALGAAVLTACTHAMNGPSLRMMIDELSRTLGPEGVVVVISEAPWWWLQHTDPVAADTAAARPLQAETWLASFHDAGFAATARYDPDGHTYAVTARRKG